MFVCLFVVCRMVKESVVFPDIQERQDLRYIYTYTLHCTSSNGCTLRCVCILQGPPGTDGHPGNTGSPGAPVSN